MNKLSLEQLRDIINALKHYQMHNISISNPRYSHFSDIISTVENEIVSNKDRPQFNREEYLSWYEESAS